MLTPIYSYYLHYRGLDSVPDESYFSTAGKAPGFQRWMDSLHIASAVYMPVDFSKLPFTIPALYKVQLAIHEAFHVEVMLRYWYTDIGHWPAWDQQPDRKGVQVCYTYEDSARTAIQRELDTLADMIEALMDGLQQRACTLGHQYLDARTKRYERLQQITVALGNGQPGDCLTAESLMELEEGLADYASWTFLYDRGLAGRDVLLKRYRASQHDHFYLSGNMLMHAILLMSHQPASAIAAKIIGSSSVRSGSLFTLFRETLESYCR